MLDGHHPENTDDPTKTIRVLMKDHAFTVDMEGAGGVARIGVLKAVEPDPETVAHFESEAAEGAVIPEKHGMKYCRGLLRPHEAGREVLWVGIGPARAGPGIRLSRVSGIDPVMLRALRSTTRDRLPVQR